MKQGRMDLLQNQVNGNSDHYQQPGDLTKNQHYRMNNQQLLQGGASSQRQQLQTQEQSQLNQRHTGSIGADFKGIQNSGRLQSNGFQGLESSNKFNKVDYSLPQQLRSLEVEAGSERLADRAQGQLGGITQKYNLGNNTAGQDFGADSSSTPAKELSSLAQTTLREEDLIAQSTISQTGRTHNMQAKQHAPHVNNQQLSQSQQNGQQRPPLQQRGQSGSGQEKRGSGFGALETGQHKSYSFIQRGNRSIQGGVSTGTALTNGSASHRSHILSSQGSDTPKLPPTIVSSACTKYQQQTVQLILALSLELTLQHNKGAEVTKTEENAKWLESNQQEIVGILQVLKWRINALRPRGGGGHGGEGGARRAGTLAAGSQEIEISLKEFDKLFEEWWARKVQVGGADKSDAAQKILNMQSMLQTTTSLCLNDIKVQLLSILQNLQIEDPQDWQLMLELLGQQLNKKLLNLNIVSQEWISKADEIWTMIVEQGATPRNESNQLRHHAMNPVTCQNFLLSLLLNEINETNIEQMPVLVRRQTGQLMKHLNHQEGIVIQRFFKYYLLQQGLCSTNDLSELRDNVLGVQKAMSTVMQGRMQKETGAQSYDILETLLEECIQNDSNRDILRFCSTDIWQGVYYLINQGMLRNSEGIPFLCGTHIESEAAIREMSQRLGQYMYVLNQQQMGDAQIKALGPAKQVMKMYGRILEKLLTAFDRESSRMLKQVCELLLMQKNQILQSSNTLVAHSSEISDKVHTNGGGPENSNGRLSHQTSHSTEKGADRYNRGTPGVDEDGHLKVQSTVENQEQHDFSAQVIKENNLLKQASNQRNEQALGRRNQDQLNSQNQPAGSTEVQQYSENFGASQSHNTGAYPEQYALQQIQKRQQESKPQFSTISIQDQQRQSLNSEASNQSQGHHMQIAPSAAASHALQLSFQNTAVLNQPFNQFNHQGSISTAFGGLSVEDLQKEGDDDHRRPSGLPSGLNSQLPSHNNSILISQQQQMMVVAPNVQGNNHPVNQSMISYKSNQTNFGGLNISIHSAPGDHSAPQGPFRTQTNSNFNTNNSNIVQSNQDYKTNKHPRELSSHHQSPQRVINSMNNNRRPEINQSHMAVKSSSHFDRQQQMAAARHGQNESLVKVPGSSALEMKSYYDQPIAGKMQSWQQQQQPNAKEQQQLYDGPVIQDGKRRVKNGSISSGAQAMSKKSSFRGVSPLSKQQQHQLKVGISKTRSRLGSIKMSQQNVNNMNNSHLGGISSLSGNGSVSVNQSISIIGGGGQGGALSNHGGADRSPIRMRHVEDYSQVMQRLKSQIPSGGGSSTPKPSRIKGQKGSVTDRSNFASSHQKSRSRVSQRGGSMTQRHMTQQQMYPSQPQQQHHQHQLLQYQGLSPFHQKFSHPSTDNLTQRQPPIQPPSAWISTTSRQSKQTKQLPNPSHYSMASQQPRQPTAATAVAATAFNLNSLSLMQSAGTTTKSQGGHSSQRDGSAASFGRANYKSNETVIARTGQQANGAKGGLYPVPLQPFQLQRPASQLTTTVKSHHRNHFIMDNGVQSTSLEKQNSYPKEQAVVVVDEENYVSGGGASRASHQDNQYGALDGSASTTDQGLQTNDAWANVNRSNINSSKSIGVTGKRRQLNMAGIAPSTQQSSSSFSPYPRSAGGGGYGLGITGSASGAGMNSGKDWRLLPNESDMNPYTGGSMIQQRPHHTQGSSNKNINPSISRLNNVSTSKSSFLYQQSLQGMQMGSQLGFQGNNGSASVPGNHYFNVNSNKQLQSSMLSSISQTTINNGGAGNNVSHDGLYGKNEAETMVVQQRMLSGKQSQPNFKIQANGQVAPQYSEDRGFRV